MKQREVQDREQTGWTLVQALSGGDAGTAEAAEQRVQDDAGRVPVVATPSGGQTSRRLHLPADWHEAMSDDQLRAAIDEASQD